MKIVYNFIFIFVKFPLDFFKIYCYNIVVLNLLN